MTKPTNEELIKFLDGLTRPNLWMPGVIFSKEGITKLMALKDIVEDKEMERLNNNLVKARDEEPTFQKPPPLKYKVSNEVVEKIMRALGEYINLKKQHRGRDAFKEELRKLLKEEK